VSATKWFDKRERFRILARMKTHHKKQMMRKMRRKAASMPLYRIPLGIVNDPPLLALLFRAIWR